MKNLITLLLILAIIVLPLITSLLLDWSFIENQSIRQWLIYLLMLLEIAILVILLLQYLKSISK